MVKRVYLFIEGAKDTVNGDLREGFRKLIEQKVKSNFPTISMGGGKAQTIKKFINSKDSKLLCDLDASVENVESDLKENRLFEVKESVFYMIQEMESWFFSQPQILDDFYGESISSKLTKEVASMINEPDKELERLTKHLKNRKYQKVRHGSALLKKLDANKLYKDFPDFKRLIDRLQ